MDSRIGVLKMRFSWMTLVALVGISVSGLAQQNNTFRVKRSAPEKAPKQAAPIAKTAGPASSSAATSKDLNNIEHQTAKASAPSKSAGKRTPGSAGALKPIKDKPNPPIKFGGAGGGKSPGMTNQGSNPYKGRLRQKHARQQ